MVKVNLFCCSLNLRVRNCVIQRYPKQGLGSENDPMAHHNLDESLSFSNMLRFDRSIDFCDLYDCNDFPLIKIVRLSREVNQKW